MLRRRMSRIKVTFVVLTGLLSNLAVAVERSPDQSPIPCGVLENFGGRVEILDASRTFTIDLKQAGGIPCGSWISTGLSVGAGWAEIKHRDGYRIHIGSRSFVGLPENNTDGHNTGDHVILYRGQVYGDAGAGHGELRIVTASARARLRHSAGVVVFNSEDDESQLIAVENASSFENRFERAHKVKVQAGEASTLNFKLMRTVPSDGRAIALANLRPKMVDLHVSVRVRDRALEVASKRLGRKLAVVIGDERSVKKHEPSRSVASQSAQRANTYVRHRSAKVDAKLHDYWVKKMAGGESVGERILYPDRFHGRPQRVSLHVEETDDGLGRAKVSRDPKYEDAEKKRLIDELSQIREE